MTNIELQRILAQLPTNLEVVAFKSGNIHLKSVNKVYVGNEKYLPGKRNVIGPDKIIIDYT